METCPKCGADAIKCITIIGKDEEGRYMIVGETCKDRQIANLKELLRGVGEYLTALENYLKYSSDEVITSGQVNMIPGGPGSVRFDAFVNLKRLEDKTLLPRITQATKD